MAFKIKTTQYLKNECNKLNLKNNPKKNLSQLKLTRQTCGLSDGIEINE